MKHSGLLRKTLLAIVLLLLGLYPFVVYFSLGHLSPRYLALCIILVFIVRYLLLKNKSWSFNNIATLLMLLAGAVMCLWVIVENDIAAIRLYPFLVSMLFLMVFSYSLINPPTVIERLARLQTPQLAPETVAYTRKVTWAWCGFFIMNGGVALITALFASLKVWTFYNGFLSYVLIGALFGVELITRYFHRKRLRLNVAGT
ncbi:MAG: hypothetical protein K5Q00_06595 [Gammaproteobacteria bacterium]|nr:hypothetical protein [Gammaproteobacteria bacterium]